MMIAGCVFINSRCGEPEKPEPEKPTVKTHNATNIRPYSATAGGEVIADGGDRITRCGVKVSKVSLTDAWDSEVPTNNPSVGAFSVELSNSQFQPNTTYAIRAFATNSAGTGWGEELTFTTGKDYVNVTFRTYIDGSAACQQKWTGATVTVFMGDTPDALANLVTLPIEGSRTVAIEKGKYWFKMLSSFGDIDEVEHEITKDQDFLIRCHCDNYANIRFGVYVEGNTECQQWWTGAVVTFLIGDSPNTLKEITKLSVGKSQTIPIKKGKYWVKVITTQGGSVIDEQLVEYEITVDEDFNMYLWCNKTNGTSIKSLNHNLFNIGKNEK